MSYIIVNFDTIMVYITNHKHFLHLIYFFYFSLSLFQFKYSKPEYKKLNFKLLYILSFIIKNTFIIFILSQVPLK